MINKLIEDYKRRQERIVDEDISMKRNDFARELERLEMLALEAQVKGRVYGELNNYDQPFGIDMGPDR